MKKIFALPILAIGLMVSQSWGQVTESGADGNCMYNGKQIYCDIGGGCYSYSTAYSGVGVNDATCGPKNTATPKCTCQQLFDGCQAAGQAYTDVDPTKIGPPNYGSGVVCSTNGGVAIAGGATKCGTCQYPGNATCDAVWSGGAYSKGETCEIAMATCTADNGTPGCTEGSANPNPSTQFCNYGPCVLDPSNQYGCLDGGCYALTSSGCADGTIVASCPVCNMPPGSRPAGSNCDGNGNGNGNGNGQEPIIISGRSVGLTVVPNGNILHIISERNATVELFSMTGAKVFSSKVAAGNSSLSLEKQKTGVYYAVVRSGAQKQTVKVILK